MFVKASIGNKETQQKINNRSIYKYDKIKKLNSFIPHDYKIS